MKRRPSLERTVLRTGEALPLSIPSGCRAILRHRGRNYEVRDRVPTDLPLGDAPESAALFLHAALASADTALALAQKPRNKVVVMAAFTAAGP